MKKLTLATLLLCFFANTARADLGSCVVYYAKFYLNDGTIFKGCFECSGYGPEAMLNDNGTNEYCGDSGVLRLISIMQQRNYADEASDGGIQHEKDFGKIPVYRNLYYLEPKPINGRPGLYGAYYGLVPQEDIVYIGAKEIKKVIFWDAKYSERAWLTSELIIGPKSMVDTVQNMRFWNTVIVDLDNSIADSLTFSDDSMWGYRLINYNPKINVEELKRLAKLKIKPGAEEKFWVAFRKKHRVKENFSIEPGLEREGRELLEKETQKIRLWFWERGILMVRINGTC